MIRAPSRGEALRASWGAAVADGINALAGLASPGSLARQGVTGTGAEALPQNRRERRAAGGASPDAFRVRACVESRREGGAAERRLVVEMLWPCWNETAKTYYPCCFYNGKPLGFSGLSGNLSLPAGHVPGYRGGFARIYVGAWADSESFRGDLDLFLKFKLTGLFADGRIGLASDTEFFVTDVKDDDETWHQNDEFDENESLISFSRVFYMPLASVVDGAVATQWIVGTLAFMELLPCDRKHLVSGSDGGDEETWAKRCVTSLTGDKAGSLPVKGAVAVSAARTGLKVGTGVVKEAGEDGSETEVASMRVEVEGLGDDEAVALRAVKDGETGETVARVMGTADVELPAGRYVAGDDTNIVFTEKKDSAGNATGEIAVDVYYR